MVVLLEWWNFMFLLPLVSGLVIGVGIAASGAIADLGDADMRDADLGDTDMGDADLGNVDAGDISTGDVDIDIAELDLEADVGNETDLSVFAQILSFFGLGQGVPLSVMLPILLMSGGLSGLLLNSLLATFISPAVIFAPFSMLGSFLLSAFTGQGLAGILRKALKGKPSSIKSGGLIGLEGKGVYALTESGGVAHVKDPFGNIHRIACKTEGVLISAGEAVLVRSYDAQTSTYIVEPVRLELGEIE